MIRNVVFDIGNVLTDYRWKEFLQEQGFDETMIKRIAKASVMTPYWDEFDRGIWTEEETMNAFVKEDPEIEQELRRAFANISDMVYGRAFAKPWIKSLKDAGYKVYYLSNFSKKAYDECRHALDFMEYTDGGILSYREHVIKPDPEIYKLFLNKFNLVATECVFIDDLERNVQGAIDAGMNSFVFKSKEQAEEELRALGVVY